MPGGDPYRQRTRGQPLEINSVAWNKMLEEARTRDVKGATGDSVALPRDMTRVKVRNDSGVAVAQFGILGLASGGGPLITPPGNLNEFTRQPALSGTKPATGDAGLFCVLLEPLQPGAIGWAAVAGVVPVQVTGAAAPLADVLAGDTTQLTLSATGAAQVLWADQGGGTRWAHVRLGGGGGAGGGGGGGALTGGTVWLGSDFFLNNTFTNTGLVTPTLVAGTYLLAADALGSFSVSNGLAHAIQIQLYDTTAAAAVTDSITTVLFVGNPTSAPYAASASIHIVYVVPASTTLTLQGRLDPAYNTVVSAAYIQANLNNIFEPKCTRLSYVKIG